MIFHPAAAPLHTEPNRTHKSERGQDGPPQRVISSDGASSFGGPPSSCAPAAADPKEQREVNSESFPFLLKCESLPVPSSMVLWLGDQTRINSVFPWTWW